MLVFSDFDKKKRYDVSCSENINTSSTQNQEMNNTETVHLICQLLCHASKN